jgi:hypothetical protein
LKGRRGIWLQAKWARQWSHLPPIIPNLVSPFGIATTPSEKAKALMSEFPPPHAKCWPHRQSPCPIPSWNPFHNINISRGDCKCYHIVTPLWSSRQ